MEHEVALKFFINNQNPIFVIRLIFTFQNRPIQECHWSWKIQNFHNCAQFAEENLNKKLSCKGNTTTRWKSIPHGTIFIIVSNKSYRISWANWLVTFKNEFLGFHTMTPAFHAVVVFLLEPNFLFKSSSAQCVQETGGRKFLINCQ